MTNTTGKKVFNNFEGRISDDLFTGKKYNEQIDLASRVAEEMPLVTMPFRANGLIEKGESTARILHVFRPNLWAQDEAHLLGKLGRMTIHSTKERADSTIEHVITRSGSILHLLAEKGKTFLDFEKTFRDSAYIESAFYTFLSGTEMPKSAEKRMKIALMKRLIMGDHDFRSVTKSAGVDWADDLALYQFSDEMSLREIMEEVLSDDPYFVRRDKQMNTFTNISSEVSVEKPHSLNEKMAGMFMERMIKKYPSLAKKVFSDVI